MSACTLCATLKENSSKKSEKLAKNEEKTLVQLALNPIFPLPNSKPEIQVSGIRSVTILYELLNCKNSPHRYSNHANLTFGQMILTFKKILSVRYNKTILIE